MKWRWIREKELCKLEERTERYSMRHGFSSGRVRRCSPRDEKPVLGKSHRYLEHGHRIVAYLSAVSLGNIMIRPDQKKDQINGKTSRKERLPGEH